MSTIRDAGISGDFIHEPLSNPQTEFRLAQVDLSGDDNSAIHCTISTYTLSNPPPYLAISYTWGDVSKKQEIWIGKERLKIGHNSWLALSQARLHRPQQPLWLWIDVLSIDQINDVEKSIQVGLMGIIFQSAMQVFASVGAHEEDSEHLIEQIHAHAEYVEQRRDLDGQEEDPPADLDAEAYCSSCGRLLRDRDVTCTGCKDAPLFCKSCADDHERDSHTSSGHPSSLHFRSRCHSCRRRLRIRWYQAPGSWPLYCRTCQRLQPNNEIFEHVAASDWKLTDFWGAVDRPAGGREERTPETHFTSARLLEMSHESQERIAEAFSKFSLRPYFTRIWVFQETKLARHVSIVCGESKFTLDAFSILAWDLRENPDYLTKRGSVGRPEHLKGWLTKRNMGSATIWELVADHVDYHCADTRDRVFALLSMSIENTIRPDYTNLSGFEVLLQLLEQEASSVYDPLYNSSSGPGMGNVWNIIGAFHLGPLSAEIADMLRLRRSAHAAPSHLSQRVVFGHRDKRHILLKADLCCTVREDKAGNMVTSLLKESPPSTHTHANDLQYIERHTEEVAVKIRNPLGRVVALADKKVKAGDMLLFSRDLGGPHFSLVPRAAGLIVRPLECGIHIVVGQVVVDHGIRPPEEQDIEKNSVGFEIRDNDWWLYISPIDLLLFVAQGMKSEVIPPSEDDGPVIKRTFCPEGTARRLTTGVTADPTSSFAVRKRDWDSLQPRLPIVLYPGSMDFP